MRNCKKICYEWSEKKGKITDTVGCKNFMSIKKGIPRCKLYGKLKSQVTGEVFYLGRKTK